MALSKYLTVNAKLNEPRRSKRTGEDMLPSVPLRRSIQGEPPHMSLDRHLEFTPVICQGHETTRQSTARLWSLFKGPHLNNYLRGRIMPSKTCGPRGCQLKAQGSPIH